MVKETEEETEIAVKETAEEMETTGKEIGETGAAEKVREETEIVVKETEKEIKIAVKETGEEMQTTVKGRTAGKETQKTDGKEGSMRPKALDCQLLQQWMETG